MTSMVAQGSSSLVIFQEKGSRNKRKFRADPPLGDASKIFSLPQNECLNFEFSAGKFEITLGNGQSSSCDMCSVNQNYFDGLKLGLELAASTLGSSEVGPNCLREDLEADECHEADWSDLTETQLEELVLSNLDMIFKSAIKKIVACGYTEEVATKAVLRSGLCYGSKDTVSNIVDNTLAFLANDQEFHPLREHFVDLQQLEKYILVELVCVLQEVRPFFSTGDAMWCLLICDMNISHACAMDSDSLSSSMGDGTSNGNCPVSSQPHLKTVANSSELNMPNPSKPTPSVPCSHSSQFEARAMPEVSHIAKPENSLAFNGLVTEKDGSTSASDTLISFGATGAFQSHPLKEKVICSRIVHSGGSKRDYILRQKSLHLDKTHRTYRCKGSSRTGKLSGTGGLNLDKKLKSLSDSTVALKNASLKTREAMEFDMPQDNGNHNLLTNAGPSSPSAFNLESTNSISGWPKTNVQSALPDFNTVLPLPAANTPPALLTADTELSLSLAIVPVSCSTEASSCSFAGIPNDKSLGQRITQNKKDEVILKLVPRVREMENLLQEWNEWAHQKVMQATRRLSKDKEELKTLRQEKEELEQLKREKQTLEENTMKKLSEMENALSKAREQVEKANSAVRALEVENAELRKEMETAKLRAAESAENCQEVSKREKKTRMKFQSWEKQKTMFQEDLMTEKRKVTQLIQELEQAKVLEAQFLDRWQQEEKAKHELLLQASSIRKERKQVEVSAKSKEDMIKSKAENNLLRYKDKIQKLENKISQIRLKSDSLKIAALRRGIDDIRNTPTPKESRASYISEMLRDSHSCTGVKRERECVMCLSDEMSVVFLPCAHQVVCTPCNELHKKQGMKDCPSCRTFIQQRIPVRYTGS